jgi:hypothetical protein
MRSFWGTLDGKFCQSVPVFPKLFEHISPFSLEKENFDSLKTKILTV